MWKSAAGLVESLKRPTQSGQEQSISVAAQIARKRSPWFCFVGKCGRAGAREPSAGIGRKVATAAGIGRAARQETRPDSVSCEAPNSHALELATPAANGRGYGAGEAPLHLHETSKTAASQDVVPFSAAQKALGAAN